MTSVIKNVFRKGTCTYNPHKLDSLTDNGCYMLGYYSSDGCITDKHRITIVSKDYALMANVAHFWEMQGPDIIHTLKTKDGTYYEIAFSNKYVADRFRFYGVHERKSLTNYISDWVKASPFANSFIRGYFDGDGCIYFHPTVRGTRIEFKITSGSKRSLEDSREILFNYGLPLEYMNIYQNKDNPKYDLKIDKLEVVVNLFRILYGGLDVRSPDGAAVGPPDQPSGPEGPRYFLYRKYYKFKTGLEFCLSKRYYDPGLQTFRPRDAHCAVWFMENNIVKMTAQTSQSLQECMTKLCCEREVLLRRVLFYYDISTLHWRKPVRFTPHEEQRWSKCTNNDNFFSQLYFK